ncbi:cell division protein DivIC [Paenibacillus sp. DS2015]|uniref:FtsB family cell division protein n=1 Tax=Paenibacillus sp. DS2015 TaxID=3373917 RepID=UPI003D1B0A61
MAKYAVQSQTKQQSTKYAGARRRLTLWMTFMVFFMGWAAYTLLTQNSQIADKSDQLSEQQAKTAAVEKSLTDLQYEVNRLQDPEYIGQLARKEFGLYKPEETPIRPDISSP